MGRERNQEAVPAHSPRGKHSAPGPPTRPLLPVKLRGRSGAPPGGGTLPLQSAYKQKQKNCRKTTTPPSYHSQVADGTFTRDRNRMNTETQWCKVSDYWVKSESLIKIVIKLLAGNCCWITFCTVLLNSDSCCHLPFPSALFSLYKTSSLLLGCEPRGQPEYLHRGVAQSS